MTAGLFGLLIPIVIIAGLVIGIRKIRHGEAQDFLSGHAIRRFFQYLILYMLLVVSAIGLSGLLGRLIERSSIVVADQADLARNLSFVVVGIPIYLALAMWTRRRFKADPSEINSFGWSFYVGVASITTLGVGMLALNNVISWSLQSGAYRSSTLARLIVFGCLWAAHWWVQLRFVPKENSRFHLLLGSLIALVTAAFGLAQLIVGAIAQLWSLGGEAILVNHRDSMWRGGILLLVGGPVWFLYWIRTYSKSKRDSLWLAYVLVVGVAGGLVVSLFAASTLLYNLLVWFVGDTGSSSASMHFRSVPTELAAAFVGIITWWYHHVILVEDRKANRSESQRVYEYLMSGIGLLAASGGIAMIFIAFVETFTNGSVLAGTGATNALLAAATLLLVGSPVWWIFWSKIQKEVLKSPVEEISSATRRVYLFVLFGLGGIVAVITLLVGVFLVFDDIFKGNFGLETLRRIRFSLSTLVTTGAISGYHWTVYRSERLTTQANRHGPNFVIMIGPKDVELERIISKITGGRVQSWRRMEEGISSWPQEDVIAALDECNSQAVVLISGAKGLQIIPIER